MPFDFVKRILPSWKNAALALLAAGLLVLAFPDFEYWFLAWLALVPLMWAVERETERGHSCPPEPEGQRRKSGQECPRSFLLGWLFGTAFFFGTCWWLTYAPIHYASIPWPIGYLLILIACLGAGIFPGIFAAALSFQLRRKGANAYGDAFFIWIATEFLRYWLTGNNWNAIGYTMASGGPFLSFASGGGVYLVGGITVLINSIIALTPSFGRQIKLQAKYQVLLIGWFFLLAFAAFAVLGFLRVDEFSKLRSGQPAIIAIQPNVPMSGVDYNELAELRQRQFDVAEAGIKKVRKQLSADSYQLTAVPQPITVILPESPMNFMYNDDREFQQYVHDFTTTNNVSLVFNSAEPDATNGKYFNSAMMIGVDGKPVAQYDKIYLLPFGEAVPVPFESILPAFVGNFSYGREYDLLPLGDAKAGVMICFESHFGQLSRRFVADGADVIIEMTNDGYLGPTPVLRQHLANAVFRAVETNRPVLRVTNVGITAYINEKGAVIDPAPSYQEDTRVWTVSKSDGSQTFYVRYGDWFAWLCTIVTLGLLIASFKRRKLPTATDIKA